MSKDKYPNIFSPPMEATVFIMLQIFSATRAVLKIGGYSRLSPSFSWGIFEPCPVLALKSQVSTAFYFLHFSMCRSVEYRDKLGIFTTVSPSFRRLAFFT